ncbi:S4 domain-containing protein [uncultured Salinisphaera sp.]|uniref:RNA-binding S4 domain-containing protein n=1 Tax=uncultured Salinisphaera sp. TaxID=359372 RepID=UPI0032B1D054|tara:strand:- start:74 stop:472 length:399 start_codon:yes stop_codon:yes gene_type:complete
MSDQDAVRVDKWLWAARFFKTRSLATTAIKGGHIELDGHKAKASAAVRAGQMLRIKKGEQRFEVEVVDVADKRGPATQAEQLYRETPESQGRRADAAAERRAARLAMPRPDSRPDKKSRRRLRRFKQGDDAG